MVGYNPRCKLCNCDKRAEAEQLHEEGASLQQVVDFLAKHGVTLSKAAVKRHFDTHFAPKDEAAKRYYQQSQEVMQEAVEKRLTDLQMLDATIERMYRINVAAFESVQEAVVKEQPVVSMYGKVIVNPKTNEPLMEKPGPPKPMVDLLNGSAAEFRQALKLKKELLGEGGDNPAKVMIVDDLEDDS